MKVRIANIRSDGVCRVMMKDWEEWQSFDGHILKTKKRIWPFKNKYLVEWTTNVIDYGYKYKQVHWAKEW